MNDELIKTMQNLELKLIFVDRFFIVIGYKNYVKKDMTIFQ